MFERNKVDNSQEVTAVPVDVTTRDGETLKGKLWIARSRSLPDVLNGPAQFLEFETFAGERSLIAKATLASVRLAKVQQAASLQGRLRDDSFDPYAILGVAKGTPHEEVRRAFLARAKDYHPDRYATAELPAEVRDYLDVMVRRINAAYATLEEIHQSAKSRAERTTPVYTTTARG